MRVMSVSGMPDVRRRAIRSWSVGSKVGPVCGIGREPCGSLVRSGAHPMEGSRECDGKSLLLDSRLDSR
jgi:hypothetical protein